MFDFRRISQAILAVVVSGVLLVSCKGGGGYTTTTTRPPANGELSGNLATTGSHYAHTFAAVGTYPYYCSLHPSCTGLAGTMVVVAGGTLIQHRLLEIAQTGGGVDAYGYATCASLSVSADTVLVGDEVTWTNNSPVPHNVTSH